MLASRSAGSHRFPSDLLVIKLDFVCQLEYFYTDKPVLSFVLRAKWTLSDPLRCPAPRFCEETQVVSAGNRDKNRVYRPKFRALLHIDSRDRKTCLSSFLRKLLQSPHDCPGALGRPLPGRNLQQQFPPRPDHRLTL